MEILAFVGVTLLWPVVTFTCVLVLQLILMPVFWIVCPVSKDGKPGLLLADLFQVLVLITSQIVVVWGGILVFRLFGQEPTPWLAAPYLAWCAIFALSGNSGDRTGRHIALSWTVGLFAGLVIAVIWILPLGICFTKAGGIVRVLIYVSTAIVAWLGLRHLTSIIVGQSHDGALKPGQRFCHLTSLALLWVGCGAALYLRHFWPLIVAVVVEYGFREAVIRSGEQR